MTCSAAGEKLQPLIIGKFKKPRCFRNINLSGLGAVYKSSSKAWTTNPIFNEYLMDLNAYMASQKRKIILFLYNAPVHIIDEETSSRLTHV